MKTEFDFVIVGGGTAGCVLADRLSADRNFEVLLLESGPRDSDLMISVPKGFSKALASRDAVWRYDAQPGRSGKSTPEPWLRGRVLGGSSSVNGMIYLRGHAEDYDSWERDLGLPGWGWSDMAPMFYALEDHALGANQWRRVGGPVHVSQTTNRTALMDSLLESAGQAGLPLLEDASFPDQEGVSYICANIHQGRRWSAARAFLDPARARPNLHVWTGSYVQRIEFVDRAARSVHIDHAGRELEVSARREIIVCAGGIESPKLLQLSGIGDAQTLGGLGIEVVHDAPAVGRNMRDHLLCPMQFRVKEGYSQNKEYRGWRLARNILRYAVSHSGLLANGPYDVTGFFRADSSASRPDATFVCAPFTVDMSRFQGFDKPMPMEDAPGCTITSYGLRPESLGSVTIASSDHRENPVIVHNHLSAESDRKVVLGIARFIRDMMRLPPISNHVVQETLPGERYSSDQEVLEAWNAMSGSAYHASGTCGMGSNPDSVLDHRLRVRGVRNLRVVDLSAFPTLISGAPNAPVMAFALRASRLILNDNGR